MDRLIDHLQRFVDPMVAQLPEPARVPVLALQERLGPQFYVAVTLLAAGVLLALVQVVLGGSSSSDGAQSSTAKKKKKKKKKPKSAKAAGAVADEASGNGKSNPSSQTTTTAKKKKSPPDAGGKDKQGKQTAKGKNKEGKKNAKKKAARVPRSESEASEDDSMEAFLRGSMEVTSFSTKAKKANNKPAAGKNKTAGGADDGFETVGKKKTRRGGKGKSKEPHAVLQPWQTQDPTAEVPSGESSGGNTMTVATRHFGLLIGPGGATLKALMAGTSTEITIPHRESGSDQVTIQGSPGNVQKAKQAIGDLIKLGFSSVTHPGIASSAVACPPAAQGVVIGPGGCNIKAIQEKLSVRVMMPERNSSSTRILLSGEKANLRLAKEAVKSLVQHGFSSVTHPGYVLREVPFPREKYSLLIGPGGQTIKSIQGDTKTKINTPDASNPNQNLVVVGPQEGVDRAVKQIQRLIPKEEEAQRYYDTVGRYENEGFDGYDEYADKEAEEFIWKG